MNDLMITANASNAISFIKNSYESKEKTAFKILQYYAAQIMNYFMQVQGNIPKGIKGEFWTNHTFRAVKNYLTDVFIRNADGKELVLRISSNQWYATYLEYGHDLRFASFPTIIERFYPMIMKDIQHLYGDTV